MKTLLFVIFVIIGVVIGVYETNASYTVKAPLNKEVTQEKFLEYYQPRRVEITRLSDKMDKYASYAYNRCLDYDLWRKNGIDYGCLSMIKTFTSENMQWDMFAEHHNSWWSIDRWICQANSQRHYLFHASDAYRYPMSHIDYCVGIRVDSYNKGKMPFYWYRVKTSRIAWAGDVYTRF